MDSDELESQLEAYSRVEESKEGFDVQVRQSFDAIRAQLQGLKSGFDLLMEVVSEQNGRCRDCELAIQERKAETEALKENVNSINESTAQLRVDVQRQRRSLEKVKRVLDKQTEDLHVTVEEALTRLLDMDYDKFQNDRTNGDQKTTTSKSFDLNGGPGHLHNRRTMTERNQLLGGRNTLGFVVSGGKFLDTQLQLLKSNVDELRHDHTKATTALAQDVCDLAEDIVEIQKSSSHSEDASARRFQSLERQIGRLSHLLEDEIQPQIRRLEMRLLP